MVSGGCDNLVGGVPSPQSSSRGRGECGKKSPFGSLLFSCTPALAAFVFHPACLNQWRESHVATIRQAISHVGADGGFDGDVSSRGGNRCSRGGALRIGVGGGRAAGVHQSRCETGVSPAGTDSSSRSSLPVPIVPRVNVSSRKPTTSETWPGESRPDVHRHGCLGGAGRSPSNSRRDVGKFAFFSLKATLV